MLNSASHSYPVGHPQTRLSETQSSNSQNRDEVVSRVVDVATTGIPVSPSKSMSRSQQGLLLLTIITYITLTVLLCVGNPIGWLSSLGVPLQVAQGLLGSVTALTGVSTLYGIYRYCQQEQLPTSPSREIPQTQPADLRTTPSASSLTEESCPPTRLQMEESLRQLLDDESLRQLISFDENMKNTMQDDYLRHRGEDIYHFINGYYDINGASIDMASSVGISPENYLRCILEVGNSRRNVLMRLQINERMMPFSSFEDIFLDNTNLTRNVRYTQLSKEEQNYVTTGIAPASWCYQKSTSSNNAIQLRNDLLRKTLQNQVPTGFIHFTKSDTAISNERIYINANKEHTLDVCSLLITDLYTSFPDIVSVKVIGPEHAGRTDNIVIYLSGGDRVREAVVEKLKVIRAHHSEWFSNERTLCKKNEAPGIATVPNLSTNESFTSELCEALDNTFVHFHGQEFSLLQFRDHVAKLFFDQRERNRHFS